MLFTSQSATVFYNQLFGSLGFTLPGAVTGRRSFPKEAMLCAFLVMKCERFSQITDLADYQDNNCLIAHYCGFDIRRPLPSYWTYDRFPRQLGNGKKNRGCVKYRIIPTDYRLSIDRTCLSFRRTYALRTECEWNTSRLKASGKERFWIRNGASTANLNTLAYVSALSIALAGVLSGAHSYRAPKSFRRGCLLVAPIWPGSVRSPAGYGFYAPFWASQFFLLAPLPHFLCSSSILLIPELSVIS